MKSKSPKCLKLLLKLTVTKGQSPNMFKITVM